MQILGIAKKEKNAIQLSKKFENKGKLFLLGRMVTLPIRVNAKIETLGFRNTVKFVLNKLGFTKNCWK